MIRAGLVTQVEFVVNGMVQAGLGLKIVLLFNAQTFEIVRVSVSDTI